MYLLLPLIPSLIRPLQGISEGCGQGWTHLQALVRGGRGWTYLQVLVRSGRDRTHLQVLGVGRAELISRLLDGRVAWKFTGC